MDKDNSQGGETDRDFRIYCLTMDTQTDETKWVKYSGDTYRHREKWAFEESEGTDKQNDDPIGEDYQCVEHPREDDYW